MANREKLGNSLQSLLDDAIGIGAGTSKNITKINPSEIQQNESQPRKRFNQEQMQTLMKSIEEHGVLQPIIISPANKGYKIIAGERRWRAAKLLGLKEIPVSIKNVDSMKALELALVENIQREDLNPIEKAHAYLELKKNFGLTHEKIAIKIGQDRSSIANTIRLLDLAEDIQELVSRGTISMGHARAILSLKDPVKQKTLGYKIVTDGLSVREVEMIASGRKTFLFSSKKSSDTKVVSSELYKSPQICDLENKLREFIGARVTIKEKNGKGKITIVFSNNSQFENITEKLKTLMKTPT
ncbi:MAG: ParB/RepB/Spo0J family partition protein [Candidatus Scalindua sediminis]|nr:ParB/RepB/Spo0J family partition protein [Candidatus Scalindua sediminis]HDY67562.1 ParB/RepB/Spo0J family partition protein [Candidatus Scalindua sp.]